MCKTECYSNLAQFFFYDIESHNIDIKYFDH